MIELLEAAHRRGSFPQASSNRELRWYFENSVSNPVCLWLLKLVFLSETSFWSFDQIWHPPDKVKTSLLAKREGSYLLFCSVWLHQVAYGILVPQWGIQFSSVQSRPTLCDPMDCSMPGFPLHHQLLGLAQTHVHWVDDAIQPSHRLSSPSPPAFNLSQHQGLF